MHRLPLPIMTVEPPAPRPQTPEEFEAYQAGPHRDTISTLHDFHFWEDDGWLYVIYHEGTLAQVFDCIVRMPAEDFLERVERSIRLAGEPAGELRSAWRRLWWDAGVWAPCGVDGTNRLYASPLNKNDIVFVRLTDGSLRALHRPVPDIAIVDMQGRTHFPTLPDGSSDFGVLQSCIRPGRFDNSHIGNNGTPIRAWVGDTAVFVDAVHGVHNRQISDPQGEAKWRLTYLPYLRLLDAATGECLYYSEEPILDLDDTWDEYVRRGRWVSAIPHLDAVMFAGGQIEADAGRNGLDDLFHFYTGVGDTAVARASFRLRELLPKAVVEDIAARGEHRSHPCEWPAPAPLPFPAPLCGWDWSLEQDGVGRDLNIVRTLRREGRIETARRRIGTRPGYFDADGITFDGHSLRLIEGLGWAVAYRGVRWTDGGSTVAGSGLLLLDVENPERVLYRSEAPIAGTTGQASGRQASAGADPSAELLAQAEELIPERVQIETRRIYELRPMPSDMTRWLRG
jgi:predicted GH43/DUF377 family glycosyl hydrolase